MIPGAVLGWDMGAAMALAQALGIDALLEIWPVFEAFQTKYVAKGLILDAEKNVSAPSPNGPSAGANAIAPPVSGAAKTARHG